MDKRAGLILIIAILALVAAGCRDREEADQLWTENSYAPESASTNALRITGTAGQSGDIEIRFLLTPADGAAREVRLSYRGACAGDEGWENATAYGDTAGLAPGAYKIYWHSYDQEAGCAGKVWLRIETGREGESAETQAVNLDNTLPGATGFVEFPQEDQGVNDEEASVFDTATSALVADPSVDFIATRYGDEYEVYSARGDMVFNRIPTNAGYRYEVVEQTGENPIGNQDPSAFSTYEEEIAAGSNPNNVCMTDLGYPCGDERLSFVEPEEDAYPFGYERIATYFDHPDSADFVVNWTSYSHTVADLGEHGSLNAEQSRSPLIFWGAGIEPQTGGGLVTRQVDIAPTVAKSMGFAKTEGVDERGVMSREVYLPWQDGRVIEEVLSGDAAKTVIILVSDGLAHTELQRQLSARGDELPNLSRFVREGAWVEHGSITNFPSVTYPSHNTIGCGLYSGHHGLVDNQYYLRKKGEAAAPINELLLPGKYWNPLLPAETLHHAVHRNLGRWSKSGGAFTASLIDPSVRGADKADLQFTDKSHEVPFPPFGLEWPAEIPGPDPAFMNEIGVFGEQLLVQAAFVELYHLFASEKIHTPAYVILDIMTTDGAGHAFGPHSDRMERVLSQIDETLGVLFGWLDEWGIAGDTMIVFTSDHAMQMGDISRSSWPMDALEPAGIRLAAETWLGAYLKVPVARFSLVTLPPGTNTRVFATVTDEGDGRVLANVRIDATDGVTARTVYTDVHGQAEFYIAAAADVRVTVSREDFSVRHYAIPLSANVGATR